MLVHYLVEFCSPPETSMAKLKFFLKFPRALYTGKKLIRMEGVDNEFIEEIAKKAEGFSGREIFKMVVAWHDHAFSKADPVLTPELMSEIFDKFQNQHKQKSMWTKGEGDFMEKMMESMKRPDPQNIV